MKQKSWLPVVLLLLSSDTWSVILGNGSLTLYVNRSLETKTRMGSTLEKQVDYEVLYQAT